MTTQKTAHRASVYIILGFLPLASSLLLTPVYTEYLTPDEYGLIALCGVLQTYLSLLVCMSIDAGFSRFYFNHYNDKSRTSELLSTALLSIVAFTLIAGILLSIVGDRILLTVFNEPSFSYSAFGWQILITSGLGMCYNVVSLYLRDSENLQLFSILSLIYFISLTACTFYGVVIANAGVNGSVYGKMTGTVVTAVVFFTAIFSKTGVKYNKALAKELIYYSLPLLIYGLMAAAFDTMDRYFISRYFTMEDLGNYNFAFVIASVIGIILASYQSAINPLLYKLMLDKTSDHHLEIKKSMKQLLSISILFSGLCIVCSYYLIIYFIDPAYHSSLYFIPFLSLSFIPRAYYMVWSYPLFVENKTRILPLINGISIVTGIAANLLLIPYLGLSAIPVSVIIIKLSQAIATRFFLHNLKLYDWRIFSFKDVNMVVIIFTVLTIVTWRSLSSIYINWIVFIPLAASLLLIPSYLTRRTNGTDR